MITPAIDGPIRRAALTIDGFSAIALARSSRFSIREGTNVCRAGMSNALTIP